MMRNNSRHLLDMLADVPDFRKCRGKRHPLQAVLGLIVIAIMVGYRQQPVNSKTNEIPISKEILQALDVVGKIVTTDALLTQRSFCRDLCQSDADYVMPVKANQKHSYLDIQQLFEPLSEIETTAAEERRFRNPHTDA